MNVAVLIGRMASEPELKQTQSGLAVCSFRVAVDRRYTKDEAKRADFITCVAWRQTAEFVSRNFPVGKPIAIQGSFQSRSYEDREGIKRVVIEILVDHVDFAGNKQEKKEKSGSPDGSPLPENFEEVETGSDDLPF